MVFYSIKWWYKYYLQINFFSSSKQSSKIKKNYRGIRKKFSKIIYITKK